MGFTWGVHEEKTRANQPVHVVTAQRVIIQFLVPEEQVMLVLSGNRIKQPMVSKIEVC